MTHLLGGSALDMAQHSDNTVDRLQFQSVSKEFTRSGRTLTALSEVSLSVAAKQFVTILGPSGCGKSTLLHIAAGLEPMSAGEVLLDGEPVTRPGPDRCMVFQKFALFPSMTVQRNVEFGLRVAGVDRTARRETAAAQLAAVGLDGFAKSYPHELSGGMQQRVAIARALVLQPRVLLMDEPFGALDAQTRIVMQELVGRIVATAGITTLFVTHSVEEAVYLGDRVVVLSARPGQITEIVDVPATAAWRDLPAHEAGGHRDFESLREHLWETVRKEMDAARRPE